ncbi:hypothetical protein MLD38_023294 [Melastoma candidum]|uniref:Uncharacterized protein n=1 Tax=Melastoma candidum TaxID=119954 RepID=A0ACB9QM05_9MYRT|nr:hypothetical protein MLD38_023294 [Melastoma candidum]
MSGPSSKPKTLGDLLEELYSKRDLRRVEALSLIVEILTNRVEHEFVEKNFATMLYLFSISVKKGSVKEATLASNAIGLMAMTVRCRNKSRELYEESIPLLSNLLQSSLKILQAVNSLAIVTFFCADYSEETEKSMQILWHLIQELDCHAAHNTNSIGMLAGKIEAWSFLLSTLDGWRINSTHWKGAVVYLSSLLEVDNEMLRVSAAEALYSIAETRSVRKFSDSDETTCCTTDRSILTITETSESLLKDNITHLLESRVPNIISCTEDGTFQRKHLFFGKETVRLSTWSESMQMNYIKRFLGGRGFLSHIQNNKLLREVFEFVEKKKQPSMNELAKPENEEVAKRYFAPVLGTRNGSVDSDLLPFKSEKETAVHKRMNKSSNSAKSKAQTQIRNKKRAFAEQRKMSNLNSEE